MTGYGRMMDEDEGGPALRPTLDGWLSARRDTHAHLEAARIPVNTAWVQRLADLLTTERAWQEQYTELIALGSGDGRFPRSNR